MKNRQTPLLALVSVLVLVSALVSAPGYALAQQVPASVAARPAASTAGQSAEAQALPGMRLYRDAFQSFLEVFELLADTNQIADFKTAWQHRFDKTDDLATEEGTKRALNQLSKAGLLLGCPETPDYKCLYMRALRAYMQYHHSPDSPVHMIDPVQRARWVAEWEHKFDNDPESFKTEAGALRAIRLMRDSLGLRFDYVQGRERTADEVQTRKANFGGLGLHVGMNHADNVVLGDRLQLLVHEPRSNSPAFGQVHYGDVIVQIGDRSVQSMTVADVKGMMLGKPGTQLRLTLRRDGSDVTVTLTRAAVNDVFSDPSSGALADAGVPIEFKGEEALPLGPGFELIVEQPEQGTPAYGKVQRGDFIDMVDGTSLQGKTVAQAVELLRGAVDSPVKLTLLRNGQRTIVDLKRGVIEQHSVAFSSLGDNVSLIQVFSFEALNVHQDVATAIARTVLPLASQSLKALGDAASLKKAAEFDDLKNSLDRGATLDDSTLSIAVEARETYEKLGIGGGVILDLANNPGGDLGMVKSIVGMTLPIGETTEVAKRVPGTDQIEVEESFLTPDFEIVTVHQGDETKVTTNPRVPLLLPANMPFVVTINGVSASGSEWLSGVLQANHRARLFGKVSRGKEEGQLGVDLPYGLSLHITDFEFFPGGKKANWTGVVVDRIVEGGSAERLNAAREEITALGTQQKLRAEIGKKALADRHDFFDRLMKERAETDLKSPESQDPEQQH